MGALLEFDQSVLRIDDVSGTSEVTRKEEMMDFKEFLSAVLSKFPWALSTTPGFYDNFFARFSYEATPFCSVCILPFIYRTSCFFVYSPGIY